MTRRAQLEQFLAAEPHDPFLRYGLALSCVSEGDEAAGKAHLEQLLAEHPRYVAGYFQLAQLLTRIGSGDDAKPLLRTGISVAAESGDSHAAAEMTAFLESL